MIKLFFKTMTWFISFSVIVLAYSTAIGGEPSPAVAAATSKVPLGVAKVTCDITDVVLDQHIDPPARQQMILGGVKALYRAAGMPVPPGLSRHASHR